MRYTSRMRAVAKGATVVTLCGLVSPVQHRPAHAASAPVTAPFPGFTFTANAEGQAEITTVAQGAAATAADLLPRDVITAVDGTDVTSAQLEAILKTFPIGASVVIDYVRPPLNVPMQRSLLKAPPLPALAARPGWIVGRCVTTTGAPLKNATVRLTGVVHRALGVTTPQGPQLRDDTYINIPVSSDGLYQRKLPDGYYATAGWAAVTFEGKTYTLPLTEVGRQHVKFVGGHRDSRVGIVQNFCLDTRMGTLSISDVAFDRPAPLGPPGSQVVLSLTPQALVPEGSTIRRFRARWPLAAPGHVIGRHTGDNSR